MDASDLKIRIFRQIDTLDSAKLEEFYGIMLNFINSKHEVEEWIRIEDDEKQGLVAAIEQLDANKGINHSQVMNKFKKKYSYA